MELLDSYLKAVRRYLPRSQRDDIVAELSVELRAQIESRESELGRPLRDDELMAIFDRFCADERRTCTEEVRPKVRSILDAGLDATDFGNARAVRNVFELLQRNQAARLSGLGELATDAELATFVADDVPTVVGGDDPGRRSEYL